MPPKPDRTEYMRNYQRRHYQECHVARWSRSSELLRTCGRCGVIESEDIDILRHADTKRIRRRLILMCKFDDAWIALCSNCRHRQAIAINKGGRPIGPGGSYMDEGGFEDVDAK